ncbi:class I SAM-dependent methyltransferase [Streptomyces alkaliphilus]|uniref:class I SAM-dependent methyltransferase n=1 Tax=Streptomyces alkaliphilus TaxID=1472722 RepID=UPI00117E5697|nr:methyltransferase domain-containing protein [Streptomyces alkaliphilus]MQS08318.1 methyltransferase domain-containing protein [Streptomyces alkaliphilus]
MEAVRDHAPGEELALATRLRRDHPADLVAAALTRARLRVRARAKFGAEADTLWFTADGVEQATRAFVAAHRARRLVAAGATRVVDLCCGNGGDALALARAGLDVLAVDRSPLACAVVEANAGELGLTDRIRVARGDVTDPAVIGDLTAPGTALFIDPARRDGRGRTFDPEAYSPPLSWALDAARRAPLAAVKVAPGIPHEALPPDAETEWVSDAGEVKEAVLWFGTGATCPRRATLLPGGHTITGDGSPAPAPEPDGAHGPVGRYLYEPDGAVIRAGLVGAVARTLGARLIDPRIAYLTSDTALRTPWATAWEITEVLPFNLKRLRALLRDREVGTLTIKKRGFATTPEELRRRLAPRGPNACTLVVTRVGDRPLVLVARPSVEPDAPDGASHPS